MQVVIGPFGRKTLCKNEAPIQDMFVHCLFANRLLEFIHPKDVINEAFDLVLQSHECIETV